MRALITGASAGIGAAFVERLAKDGYDLVLVARRKDRLDQLGERARKEYGVAVDVVSTDLGNAADVAALTDRIAAGPALDLLINNAGFGAYMPFSKLPPERAEELVRVQVVAPVLLTRAALPAMIAAGHGAVVNIASLLAFSGFAASPLLPPRAIYAATKSFLVTFSQLLEEELRETGVRIMVVCPGFVKTEFHPIQGMDISSLPFAATPDVIVQATMAGLPAGELFCFPTIDDTIALEHFKAAEQELLAGGRSGTLAPRYSSEEETM
jgi:short-subunit dehydrogenase